MATQLEAVSAVLFGAWVLSSLHCSCRRYELFQGRQKEGAVLVIVGIAKRLATV